MPNEILRVENLQTYFNTEAGVAWAVDGVGFTLYENEVLGIVGESGSGKSVTALSILKLIPNPPGFIHGGQIFFKGEDLISQDYERIRKIRGREISMIFQEPMTSLNPVFTIADQVAEAVQIHHKASRWEARERAAEILELVGIPDVRARLDDYPHQFSGGMRQRVMIAMALVLRPSILIADEPTTALDVTIQAQILELMLKLKEETQGSIILITHDMAVVAEMCNRVVVMYCGRVQEIGTVDEIFHESKHPYTRGLLKSLPDPRNKKPRLATIPGMVPSILDLPKGCSFADRCPDRMARCEKSMPPLLDVGKEHMVRCFLYEEGKAHPVTAKTDSSFEAASNESPATGDPTQPITMEDKA